MEPQPAPPLADDPAAAFTRRFAEVQRLAERRERRLLVRFTAAAVVLAVLVGWATFALSASVWPARALVLGVVAAAFIARRRRWPRQWFLSPRLAHHLRSDDTGFASGLTSAAELTAKPRGSEALVRAHLKWARSVLDDKFVARQLDAFFRAQERNAARALGAGAIVLLLAGVAASDAARRYGRQLLLNDDSEWATFPIVGDLTLMLHSPAYTGAAPREIKGGDGTIRALRGTTVRLHATAEQKVSSAELQIGGDDNQGTPPTPKRVIALSVTNGRDLFGEFVLDQSERYRFVLRPFFGTALKERRGHAIAVLDDKAPRIVIDQPLEDLELRDTGRVLFKYEAEDDFAISELALVYKVGARVEQRISLPLPERRQKFHGDYAFDLVALQLRPGDEVMVHLEAKDNDTIGGPKIGTSATRRLRVFSAEQHRRELLAKLRDLMDRFVDLLADELENPVIADLPTYARHALTIDDRAIATIADLMQIARALLEADERTKEKFGVSVDRSARDLANAYGAKRGNDQAQVLMRSALESSRETAVQMLERTIVYFEDLRGLATIEEIKTLAKELSQTSQDLKTLIESYKESHDPTLKTALEQEIAKVRQRLDEIRKKMAELQRGLNEGFVNKEAFDRNQVQNTLDSLEQMLAEDRLDDLSKELERLGNQLDNMSKQIDKTDKEYGEDRYASVRQEIKEFQQQFEAVEQAEKNALDESEKIEQQYRQEVQRRIGANLEELVKQTQADLQAAEKKLEEDPGNKRIGREPELAERVEQRINDAKRSLEAKDFLETRDMLRDAVRSAADLARQLRAEEAVEQAFSGKGKPIADRRQRAEQAGERLGKAVDRLEKLFPNPRDVLTPQQMGQLSELQRRQQEIARQSRGLSERMQQINQQAPIFDQNAQDDMKGASGDMDRASGELNQGQSAKAASAQRSALGRLQKLREQMQQQESGSGQGQGVPRPFGGTPNGQKNGGDGRDPSADDKVEIPNGDAFKVPPEFRRDILDAMKQGMPEQFKQQVEDFYRELIK